MSKKKSKADNRQMSKADNRQMSKADNPQMAANMLPLFYKQPIVLRFDQHAKKAIKPSSGFAFSADTLAVPLLLGEFGRAVRHYPIVFTNGDLAMPAALLGLKQAQNLFLQPDGNWRAATYVPGYLRRYPFIFTQGSNNGERMLAIDAASDRFVDAVSDADGQLLFDEAGKPTNAAKQALAFCHSYHEDHVRSEAFGKALLEHGLLIERQANMQFPDKSSYRLEGFSVVDATKFSDLSDPELLRDWHAKGWLGAVSLHLTSLLNWETLMQINAEQKMTEMQGAA